MERAPNCRFCKKSLISVRELIRCRSLAFKEVRPCWLTVAETAPLYVLAQAFESSRFPLEQGESFSDLSCLTCARRAVRLASSVSNLTSPCNERTWNAKGTDTIMTSPDREPPKTSTKKSEALRSPTGITPLGIYPVFIATKGARRPTRHLPHAKMLLVPISFFLCWVDYALEGSTFSLSKYDFSRVFHTERSWHTYRFTVVFVSGRQDLPSDARAFS